MNNMVFKVFKTLMLAIILVFVVDIVQYLYMVFSLNAKMENLMTSMRKVVMENNYMPEEDATLYCKLLEQIAKDYNTDPKATPVTYKDSTKKFTDGANYNNFIYTITTNFNSDAVDRKGSPLKDSPGSLGKITASRFKFENNRYEEVKNVDVVHWNLYHQGDYGDIACVQVRVGVLSPVWSWGGTGTEYNYDGQDANSWNRFTKLGTILSYTYYVPCLKYRQQI